MDFTSVKLILRREPLIINSEIDFRVWVKFDNGCASWLNRMFTHVKNQIKLWNV